MNRGLRSSLLLLCGLGIATNTGPARLAAAAPAPAAPSTSASQGRHYVARLEHNRGVAPPARRAESAAALADLAGQMPDLAVTRDETTSAVRSLGSHVGYLTEARPEADAMAVA